MRQVDNHHSNPSVPEWPASQFGQAVTLILAKSADGITVATDALDAVLEREYVAPDQDKARYVRNTIEPHRTSLPAHSVLDLAIDVVRDTLLAAEDADSRAGAVAQLLRSPWPTERRIGIAHCFLRRADLPLHETAIITGENLANPHLFHELAKLLADDTSDLSEGSVRALKDFAAALHAEPSETGRYDYASWARIMPDDWLPEPFPAGDDDEDDPDRRLFRDVYFSGVFWPTAPLDQTGFAERAAELGSDDLLDLVRDPATAGVRVTWRHDPGPMWALLAEYAKGRDQLEPLLGIGPGDLRRERGISWPVIEALADIAGDSPERWADVLGWAVRMMSEVPSDEFWFLGVLLEKGGRIAPLAVSEGVRSLAMRVIEQAKRTGAVESELIDDASMRGGFLNHPAGKATQSLFELFRREMAEQEAAADGEAEIPAWFRMSVLESLDRTPMHLGIDAWIGLGRYYALLCERSPDAVAFVAPHLESDRPDVSITSIAFWSGYLWSPSVSSDALTLLLDAYRLHARTLQKEDVIEADLRDVFCQHIVIGVLREIRGFGDILYDTLGDGFDPVSRGAIASALGRGIAEAAENPETLSRSLATEQFREILGRTRGTDRRPGR